MNLFCRVFLTIVWTAWSQAVFAEGTLIFEVLGKEQKLEFADFKGKLKKVKVTIDDPVYKTKKSYDGFKLVDVLALAGFGQDQAADIVTFTADDGFSAKVPVADIRAHEGILAFAEQGRAPFQFDLIREGKSEVSPAPYYLVWKEGAKLTTVPWPFRLARISVSKVSEKDSKIYPQNALADSAVMKGYDIYKLRCSPCHSINVEGGEVGPELNVPKNITEYWDLGVLKAFIHNSGNFRYRSRMPPFTDLSEADINYVVSYLQHMKDYKIMPP